MELAGSHTPSVSLRILRSYLRFIFSGAPPPSVLFRLHAKKETRLVGEAEGNGGQLEQENITT